QSVACRVLVYMGALPICIDALCLLREQRCARAKTRGRNLLRGCGQSGDRTMLGGSQCLGCASCRCISTSMVSGNTPASAAWILLARPETIPGLPAVAMGAPIPAPSNDKTTEIFRR